MTSIYNRSLHRRSGDVSLSLFALLFAETVAYSQKHVKGVNELEERLNSLGYSVGYRMSELVMLREGKNGVRSIEILELMRDVHQNLWKALYGRSAHSLEKSRSEEDEYMIIDNNPIELTFISVPKDISQLSCAAFTAGIVEAALDGAQFPARVTAHSSGTDQFPQRTIYLVKFEPQVVEREASK
ncbi:hypothetical protein CANCADRAFT_87698 [Tortispora caseinolytica NRRL Y-17796]|uniref:Trafficking protein particle complex subunit n=1 Tax=Tortispora caseinolytica NRRL Y-17796 TaxID=767744 RepID=A0A1E4TLA8_9ASCO|nr:hypothetical protein CANCADRAFT_87698 [Tortispora caseinolytica NRRL Y-17796]